MKNLYIIPALLLFAATVSAQTPAHSKLIISKNQKYVVGPENVLHVDTLVMEDKATIEFSPETTGTLKANVAIVGNKCTITSRGANGLNSDSQALGTAGQNGGDLDIALHFDKLGSLSIDTRGGRGGNGGKFFDTNGEIFTLREVKLADGRKAIEKIPTPVGFYIPKTGNTGVDATTGFNGGNGGNIHFTYSSKKFIPVFNSPRGKHRITLLHTAGGQGRDGVTSKDGRLIDINSEKPIDGGIRITNTNNVSGQN